ncbi:hypothetical protein BV22DRAFT_574585 [Leucogyrophana mollusca]|uniref:Uncharacterized protein n=1 Tax=Leucogyrophana mollusca TaxID=85980 RepID=A0ACB8BED6_9AGAM|nr:hypothetical protein BV22DRAFT_574585 [Leucogyrophana mollusca]
MIASIEFKPPFLVSGSSDRHLRMFDIMTSQGWSTCPEFEHPLAGSAPHVGIAGGSINGVGIGTAQGSSIGTGQGQPNTSLYLHSSLSQSLFGPLQNGSVEVSTTLCSSCRAVTKVPARRQQRHTHLVRSVALGDEFAISGSYDLSVKVDILLCEIIPHRLILLVRCGTGIRVS